MSEVEGQGSSRAVTGSTGVNGLMGSPTFLQVFLKMLGSDEVAIAKEIQKAVKQTPGVWPRAPTSLPGSTHQMSSVVCFNCSHQVILEASKYL